jgi:hypothetical protein
MIRQVDKSRFDIPMSGHPKLHREVTWYATDDDADDDAVLGVVILDLIDKNYSWVMLTENDRGPGYTAR